MIKNNAFTIGLIKTKVCNFKGKILIMKLTALIEKSDDGWFVGQLEELPEILSQGKTISELKANLLDALNLLLDSNRKNVEFENKGKEVIREQLEVG